MAFQLTEAVAFHKGFEIQCAVPPLSVYFCQYSWVSRLLSHEGDCAHSQNVHTLRTSWWTICLHKRDFQSHQEVRWGHTFLQEACGSHHCLQCGISCSGATSRQQRVHRDMAYLRARRIERIHRRHECGTWSLICRALPTQVSALRRLGMAWGQIYKVLYEINTVFPSLATVVCLLNLPSDLPYRKHLGDEILLPTSELLLAAKGFNEATLYTRQLETIRGETDVPFGSFVIVVGASGSCKSDLFSHLRTQVVA